MKKFVVSLLISAFLFGLAACSGQANGEIASLEEISGLITEKGYSEEDIQEKLLGKHEDDIILAWGEPDGFLSGFWGDIWYLSGESNQQIMNQQIVLYYDENGTVETVKITGRML